MNRRQIRDIAAIMDVEPAMIPFLGRLEYPDNMLNPWGRTLLAELGELGLGPHSRVLDVPCGTGGVAGLGDPADVNLLVFAEETKITLSVLVVPDSPDQGDLDPLPPGRNSLVGAFSSPVTAVVESCHGLAGAGQFVDAADLVSIQGAYDNDLGWL